MLSARTHPAFITVTLLASVTPPAAAQVDATAQAGPPRTVIAVDDPITTVTYVSIDRGHASVELLTAAHRRIRAEIDAIGADGFRLRVGPDSGKPFVPDTGDRFSAWPAMPLLLSESADALSLAAAGPGAVQLVMPQREFSLELRDRDGNEIVRLSPVTRRARGERGRRIVMNLAINPGERLFGPGANGGAVERSGFNRPAVAAPVLLSTRGWGLAVLSGSAPQVSLTGPQGALSQTGTIDVLVLICSSGNRMKELLRRYSGLIGRPVRPPKWAFGTWIGRDEYPTQAALEEVAGIARARRFPVDAVHADRIASASGVVLDRSLIGKLRNMGIEASVGPIGEASVTQATWEGMRGGLRAALSAGLAGSPLFSIGIAAGTGAAIPPQELFIRWAGWGLLSPLARFIGPSAREPWAFGTEAEAIVASHAHRRYSLLPYLLAAAGDAADNGWPMMRHLSLEEPGDERAIHVDDQFLLGPDLLVAPVLVEGARIRQVYFPRGRWYGFDRPDDRRTGPALIDIPVPIGEVPIFVREGAVIPRLQGRPLHLKGGPSGPIRFDIHVGEGSREISYQDDGLAVHAAATQTAHEIQIRIDPVPMPVTIRVLGHTGRLRAVEIATGKPLLIRDATVAVNARNGADVRFDLMP